MRIESICAHQFVTVVYYPQFTHWFRCPRRVMRCPSESEVSVQLRFLLSSITCERSVDVDLVTLKWTGYYDSGSTYKLILTASSHSLLSNSSKTPRILGRAATLSTVRAGHYGNRKSLQAPAFFDQVMLHIVAFALSQCALNKFLCDQQR